MDMTANKPLTLGQRRYGMGYEPGSIASKMTKGERRAFEKWLKQCDKDLADMERWGRTRAG